MTKDTLWFVAWATSSNWIHTGIFFAKQNKQTLLPIVRARHKRRTARAQSALLTYAESVFVPELCVRQLPTWWWRRWFGCSSQAQALHQTRKHPLSIPGFPRQRWISRWITFGQKALKEVSALLSSRWPSSATRRPPLVRLALRIDFLRLQPGHRFKPASGILPRKG